MQLLNKFKFNLKFSTVITTILILVILAELYFGYTLLYSNLNLQATEILPSKVIKVDLQAYRETTELIEGRQNFAPGILDLDNTNPFKYK